jgi:RNA polymerase sigma-70 factor (ECF subfamily)
LRARDPAALERLYRQHGGLVHGLALRILQDGAEAEEVTQDVFLYVWQHAERFDPARGSLASWLVTLARSRGIDRLRSRGSRERRREGLKREVDADLAAHEPADPLQHALAAERRTRVRRALALLPPEQRSALEIAYFEGLSHSEIAARLQAPLGTVKTRIRQGMIRLRDALAQA